MWYSFILIYIAYIYIPDMFNEMARQQNACFYPLRFQNQYTDFADLSYAFKLRDKHVWFKKKAGIFLFFKKEMPHHQTIKYMDDIKHLINH